MTEKAGPVVPGDGKKADSRALEAGAAMIQSRIPLTAMNMYLNGFHFYADDMGRQVEAHHFCAQINEDFIQCTIFDGNNRHARLMGVEYIVGERLFRHFPEEEKRLWHSHHYEVGSGTLIAPGLPARIEHRLMKKIVSTYGKTWHTWERPGDSLPFGIPKLMMGFTKDGQLSSKLLKERDRRFWVSSTARRNLRRDIPRPRVVSGANVWESGKTCQLEIAEKNFPV